MVIFPSYVKSPESKSGVLGFPPEMQQNILSNLKYIISS